MIKQRQRSRYNYKKLVFIITLFFVSTIATKVVAQNKQVLVSIAPLESMVTQMLEGVTKPELLFAATTDPHHLHIKPSQKNVLDQADIFIFIHPAFETGLATILPTLSRKTHMVALGELLENHLLTLRGTHHHDDDHHHQQHLDYHFWLSPQLMSLASQKLLSVLIEIFPEHKDTITHNTHLWQHRMQQLRAKLQADLSTFNVPYYVAHDAYQYFEQDFHLKSENNWQIMPEIGWSPKTLEGLIQALSQHKTACFFYDTHSPQQLTHFLEERAPHIYIQVLNPLVENYEHMLNDIAHAFLKCADQEKR